MQPQPFPIPGRPLALLLALAACQPAPPEGVEPGDTGGTTEEPAGTSAGRDPDDTGGSTSTGAEPDETSGSTGDGTGSSATVSIETATSDADTSAGETSGETSAGETSDSGTSDSGTSDSGPGDGLPDEPVLALGFSAIKRFDFAWAAVPGADHYRLLESAGPGEPFVQLGGDLVGESISLTMPLVFRHQASYVLRACNAMGCTDSDPVPVMGSLATAVGYLKASNVDSGDEYGEFLALSGDGSTLAVGVPFEGSNATGIDGDQNAEGAPYSGAVYVYARDASGQWSQQAYIKASNTREYAFFGSGVALSADGSVLAVGSSGEDGASSGIGGNQTNYSLNASGAVYVLVRDAAGQWSHQAYIKASNADVGDNFGGAVALSSDGNVLAVGAASQSSNATGIDGDELNDLAFLAGAAYVFVRDPAGQWSQQAFIKASNTDALDFFGRELDLDGDGDTLAIAAYQESSSATGIDGDQADDSLPDAGAAYVFVRDAAGQWSQQAYIKASNPGVDDAFGSDLDLSDDGDTLAVSATDESSNATGIDGDQANDLAPQAGAVYVFVRDGMEQWSQQAYVKASNTETDDRLGWNVALSGDGSVLAVGAHLESSDAIGIGGDQANNLAPYSGAVYVLVRDAMGQWSHHAYVKAPNTDAEDGFGLGVALSDDAGTLAVGAPWEDGGFPGIGSDQTNDSGLNVGAVYLY